MKKKILILHPSLIMGGAEKVLVNMLNALDYDRVEVTLWLMERGGVLEKELTDKVKLEYAVYSKYFPENSFGKLIKNWLKNGELSYAFRAGLFYIASLFTNDDYEREKLFYRAFPIIEKVDLLIVYQLSSTKRILPWIFRFHAKNRVAWLHGEENSLTPVDVRKSLYSLYNRIFCVSESVKSHFINNHPELSSKADVFYNVQNTKEIIERSNEQLTERLIHPCIVTVSRLSAEKGIDRIPETVRLLVNNGYGVTWYVVGDGKERLALERMCTELGVDDHIMFLGEKENPYPYIRNADIYVQPSRTEGYCTTTVEAKILKKPIIVTDVFGMREQFVDGETAIIVKEQTPEALYKAIKDLLDHPAKMDYLVCNLNREDMSSTNSLKQLYDLL